MMEASGGVLRRVLWVGGGCGAGKSSVARAISRRFDLQLYAADARGYDHLSRLTGDARPAASHDERWLDPKPEELAESFIRGATEKFPLVLEDLTELTGDGPLMIAEGPTMLPDLVYPHLASPGHGLWLIPTGDFQRRMLAKRSTGASLGTSDPERAQANLLARNRILDHEIQSRALVLGLPTIEIDGSMTLDETEQLVADHFASEIEAGPRAASGAERRHIRRRENTAAHANATAYLQDIGMKYTRDAPPLPLSCECANLGCEVEIPISPGAYSDILRHENRYAVAAGHESPGEAVNETPGGVLVVSSS